MPVFKMNILAIMNYFLFYDLAKFFLTSGTVNLILPVLNISVLSLPSIMDTSFLAHSYLFMLSRSDSTSLLKLFSIPRPL